MSGTSQTLADLLRRTAARFPAKVAIVCGELPGPTPSSTRCATGWPPACRHGVDRRPRGSALAQLACVRRAALRARAPRRGAGADQLHAQRGRGALHPAARGRPHARVDAASPSSARGRAARTPRCADIWLPGEERRPRAAGARIRRCWPTATPAAAVELNGAISRRSSTPAAPSRGPRARC